jgi:hypothetical protein
MNAGSRCDRCRWRYLDTLSRTKQKRVFGATDCQHRRRSTRAKKKRAGRLPAPAHGIPSRAPADGPHLDCGDKARRVPGEVTWFMCRYRFQDHPYRSSRVVSPRNSRCLAVVEAAGRFDNLSQQVFVAGRRRGKRAGNCGPASVDLVPPAPNLATQNRHAVREENLSRPALWRRHVATGVLLNHKTKVQFGLAHFAASQGRGCLHDRHLLLRRGSPRPLGGTTHSRASYVPSWKRYGAMRPMCCRIET